MPGIRKHAGGRPRKPTALHKIQGTYRADRHARRATEPQPLGDLIEPPPELTDAQQASWRYAIQHAPKGLLKLSDKALLKVWVEAEDRHNTARMMLAKQSKGSPHPLLVKAPDGRGLVVSPYVRVIDIAAKLLIRAGQELGFSPAARTGIRLDATPKDDDDRPATSPWDALRVIPGGRSGGEPPLAG